MKKHITTSIVLAALACAAPAAAQDPPCAGAAAAGRRAPRRRPPMPPINMDDMRHHIYVMEGALAQRGRLRRQAAQSRDPRGDARRLHAGRRSARPRRASRRLRRVLRRARADDAPEHDVEPAHDARPGRRREPGAAINELRRSMQGITDPDTRASLEKAVRQLERPGARRRRRAIRRSRPGIVMPDAGVARGRRGHRGRHLDARAPGADAAADSVWAKDPNRAYTEAVTRALVDAMIDYSTPMHIGRRPVADRGGARRRRPRLAGAAGSARGSGDDDLPDQGQRPAGLSQPAGSTGTRSANASR